MMRSEPMMTVAALQSPGMLSEIAQSPRKTIKKIRSELFMKEHPWYNKR
jgi:hypothetical protein